MEVRAHAVKGIDRKSELGCAEGEQTVNTAASAVFCADLYFAALDQPLLRAVLKSAAVTNDALCRCNDVGGFWANFMSCVQWT